MVTDQARSISEPGTFYTTNIVHKGLLENGSDDDTADFGDSDEEILHEMEKTTGSCTRIRIEIKGRARPFGRTNFTIVPGLEKSEAIITSNVSIRITN